MLQGVSFVHGKQVMEAIMQIKRKGPYVPDGVSEFSKRIVRECMALRPTERIKLNDLLKLLSDKVDRRKSNNQKIQVTQSNEAISQN